MPPFPRPFVSKPLELDENAGYLEQLRWHVQSLRYKAQVTAFEAAKNVAVKAAHGAADLTAEHVPDVFSRTPQSAYDRLHPQNAFRAVKDPKAILDYEWQYVQIMLNHIHMAMHPLAHAMDHYNALKHPLAAAQFYARYIDRDGWSAPLRHTTRAMGEQFKDKLADIIVMAAFTKAVLSIPRYRAKTEAMRDWLFPRSSLYWRWIRNRSGNIFITNHPSRLFALPHIFGAMFLYQHLGNIGRSIESEAALRDNKETRPLYDALVGMKKEKIFANAATDMLGNLKKTAKTPFNARSAPG